MAHDSQPEITSPIITLTCCCCGDYTQGRQWWNRDTGYGLCTGCIDFCSNGTDEKGMTDLYGIRGTHYDVKP